MFHLTNYTYAHYEKGLYNLFHHLIKQGFVAINHIIFNGAIADLFEVFAGAVDFQRLNFTKLKG